MNLNEPETEAPELSFLILTHNDSHYADECLSSIRKNVTGSYEVLLLDNGSANPEDIKKIQEKHPWVNTERVEKNLGFPAGTNRLGRKARGKYLLLLNIDTVLLTDTRPAIAILDKYKEVAVVGARMHKATKELRPSTGHFPAPYRLWLFSSLWAKPSEVYGDPADHAFRVDWVEGSFLMVRSELWHQLEGMDERNFLYGDDIEFCRRIYDLGLKVVHCADVGYIHYGGYVVSRMAHLYAGFRHYHRRFSSKATQRRADLVLKLGLVPRIAVYGVLSAVTRNADITAKYRRFVDVQKTWPKMDLQ